MQQLDDPNFLHITYRRGASGSPTPIVRGTGIRVQTLLVAQREWLWPPARIAAEYGLTESRVAQALAFYQAHLTEIDLALAAED